MQLLACLSGCAESAQLCKVISTGRREYAYTVLYRAMREKIGGAANISREDTKRAIMTSLCSSEAIPNKVVGRGELQEIFYRTMEERAPGVWKLNKALRGLLEPYALAHQSVIPENFHCDIPIEDKIQIRCKCLVRPSQ